MRQSILFLLILASHSLFAQLNPVTVSIPMRDTLALAADVYLPNNDSTPRPTILIQTPYNKNLYPLLGLPLMIGTAINSSPFNFVIVDWRCFYGSLAACTAPVNRGQDGYDCVEWIAAQPWSDGQVATWGPSALGLVQFQTAKEHPPHLVCSAPIVAGMSSGYLKYYPGGVYRTEYVDMLDVLGYGLSTTILAHPVRDIYWILSESLTFYPDSIDVPMFMIGGWYDHATEEVLESFEGIRTMSNPSVRSQHKLLMGPWTHNRSSNGGLTIGELTYPEAENASDSLARAFFDYYLLNIPNGWTSRPVVSYFQMGENSWKSDTSWNTSGMQQVNLYMHQIGALNPFMPTSGGDSLNIVYDPRDPSPTIGGPTLHTSLNQGPYDQAPDVESRNDILTFTSWVLPQDIVLRGRPVVHLSVSSDMLDTDFAVRLTDVSWDGSSMLVQDGIRRMRFRNGYAAADTSNIVPGTIYSLDIELFGNTAITFLAGHSIRVDVTSSNYPRFDSNLNNGQAMYVAGDTLVATNTVYLNQFNSSYITLPLESFPISVDEVQSKSFINIYPNPATDHVFIMSHQINDMIILTDITGRVLRRIEPGSKGFSIDLSNYSKGVYIIKSLKSGITNKLLIQ